MLIEILINLRRIQKILVLIVLIAKGRINKKINKKKSK